MVQAVSDKLISRWHQLSNVDRKKIFTIILSVVAQFSKLCQLVKTPAIDAKGSETMSESQLIL
jgi:hypothetical protein